MKKQRMSLVAIMAAFAKVKNQAESVGLTFMGFASQFHIKKSGKNKSRGKMIRSNQEKHYTTPWKEVLMETYGTIHPTASREARRRVMQQNSIAEKTAMHIHRSLHA